MGVCLTTAFSQMAYISNTGSSRSPLSTQDVSNDKIKPKRKTAGGDPPVGGGGGGGQACIPPPLSDTGIKGNVQKLGPTTRFQKVKDSCSALDKRDTSSPGPCYNGKITGKYQSKRCIYMQENSRSLSTSATYEHATAGSIHLNTLN